jgi:hypothetical protein
VCAVADKAHSYKALKLATAVLTQLSICTALHYWLCNRHDKQHCAALIEPGSNGIARAPPLLPAGKKASKKSSSTSSTTTTAAAAKERKKLLDAAPVALIMAEHGDVSYCTLLLYAHMHSLQN